MHLRPPLSMVGRRITKARRKFRIPELTPLPRHTTVRLATSPGVDSLPMASHKHIPHKIPSVAASRDPRRITWATWVVSVADSAREAIWLVRRLVSQATRNWSARCKMCWHTQTLRSARSARFAPSWKRCSGWTSHLARRLSMLPSTARFYKRDHYTNHWDFFLIMLYAYSVCIIVVYLRTDSQSTYLPTSQSLSCTHHASILYCTD